jgi:hypothetical protein
VIISPSSQEDVQISKAISKDSLRMYSLFLGKNKRISKYTTLENTNNFISSIFAYHYLMILKNIAVYEAGIF